MKTESIYIQANGLRFHCITAGKGPLCLCLHGFPDTRHSWRNQVPLLAKSFKVVVPDMRGYGETDAPRNISAYRLENLIEDIRGIISAFNQKQAVLVSHDWGGVVAVHYAQAHPETVTKLVLSNAPHLGDYVELLFRKRSLRQLIKCWYVITNQVPYFSETLLSLGNFAILERLVKLYAVRKEAFTPEVMAEWKNILRRSGLRGGVNYYRANFLRFRDFFKRSIRHTPIPCPVQVIWGENDRSLERDLALMLAKHVAGPFDIKFIKNCGHWVQQEAPEEYNQHLVDFLGL